MAMQQELAVSTPARVTVSAWVRMFGGLALCIAIAAAADVAAGYAPVVGAPIFAIAFGIVIANTLRGPFQIGTLRLGDVSKFCLKGGIILLGASLDLGIIVRTGADSLPVAGGDDSRRSRLRPAHRTDDAASTGGCDA